MLVVVPLHDDVVIANGIAMDRKLMIVCSVVMANVMV